MCARSALSRIRRIMGTRGFITFVIDGEEKTAYNHWDSYPAGLGVKMLDWAYAESAKASTIDQIRNLRVVAPDSTPTDEDIAALSKFHNSNVSTGQTEEWYSLLRET